MKYNINELPEYLAKATHVKFIKIWKARSLTENTLRYFASSRRPKSTNNGI